MRLPQDGAMAAPLGHVISQGRAASSRRVARGLVRSGSGAEPLVVDGDRFSPPARLRDEATKRAPRPHRCPGTVVPVTFLCPSPTAPRARSILCSGKTEETSSVPRAGGGLWRHYQILNILKNHHLGSLRLRGIGLRFCVCLFGGRGGGGGLLRKVGMWLPQSPAAPEAWGTAKVTRRRHQPF